MQHLHFTGNICFRLRNNTNIQKIFMKKKQQIIKGDPQSPLLEKRGAYFWIIPAQEGVLQTKEENGTDNLISQKQLIFIEDFNTKQLFLNNTNITTDLQKTAEQFRLESEDGDIETEGAKYAFQTTQLERNALGKYLKKKKLCTNLFMQARHGTMTAIMGGSGCGKSIFIKMLVGCNVPSKGKIHVMGKPLSEMMSHVGYVPQGDVLLPELTGKISLNYTLKLFAPYLTSNERQLIISHVTKSLDIDDDVMNMQIGRPDLQGGGPSGGERRRISIAHELVRFPEIIILDEPTSGLSASDAELVIMLLKNLAEYHKMTIITSIHSPSQYMFDQFDDLLLVGSQGRICYYGKTSDAREVVLHNLPGNVPDNLIRVIRNEQGQNPLIQNYYFNYNRYLQGQSPNEKYYFPPNEL